jgi:hypothetical protein
MSESLEYREDAGSPEAHMAIMKNRVESAKDDYDNAVAKKNPAQIATTKRLWEQAQQEYDDFLAGIPAGAKPEKRKEATQ